MILFQKQQELLKNSALCAMIKKQERDKEERRAREAHEKAELARLEILRKIERENAERRRERDPEPGNRSANRARHLLSFG